MLPDCHIWLKMGCRYLSYCHSNDECS